MFGIERLDERDNQWKRLWVDYLGAPLVYDNWAVKYAIEFAAELDKQTGYSHRLCVIASRTQEEESVLAYVAKRLGER